MKLYSQTDQYCLLPILLAVLQASETLGFTCKTTVDEKTKLFIILAGYLYDPVRPNGASEAKALQEISHRGQLYHFDHHAMEWCHGACLSTIHYRTLSFVSNDSSKANVCVYADEISGRRLGCPAAKGHDLC